MLHLTPPLPPHPSNLPTPCVSKIALLVQLHLQLELELQVALVVALELELELEAAPQVCCVMASQRQWCRLASSRTLTS